MSRAARSCTPRCGPSCSGSPDPARPLRRDPWRRGQNLVQRLPARSDSPPFALLALGPAAAALLALLLPRDEGQPAALSVN